MRGSNASGGQLDLVLLAGLAALGEVHGYALISSVRQRTEGELDVPEGSVYPALQRLERDGYVEGRWEDGAKRPRRLYRLSTDGRAALRTKQVEWRGFAHAMDQVVRWAPA
jgi:DNA-binding PadR family transcriptional regulator